MLDDSAGNMTSQRLPSILGTVSPTTVRIKPGATRPRWERRRYSAEDDSSHMLMRFSGIAESMGNSGALGLTPA